MELNFYPGINEYVMNNQNSNKRTNSPIMIREVWNTTAETFQEFCTRLGLVFKKQEYIDFMNQRVLGSLDFLRKYKVIRKRTKEEIESYIARIGDEDTDIENLRDGYIDYMTETYNINLPDGYEMEDRDRIWGLIEYDSDEDLTLTIPDGSITLTKGDILSPARLIDNLYLDMNMFSETDELIRNVNAGDDWCDINYAWLTIHSVFNSSRTSDLEYYILPKSLTWNEEAYQFAHFVDIAYYCSNVEKSTDFNLYDNYIWNESYPYIKDYDNLTNTQWLDGYYLSEIVEECSGMKIIDTHIQFTYED